MADTSSLAGLGAAMGKVVPAAIEPAKPKLDAQGRAYATGRRKNAVARVWIKRGTGKIIVNDRAFEEIGRASCRERVYSGV